MGHEAQAETEAQKVPGELRKNSFTAQRAGTGTCCEHWNRLPREGVESRSWRYSRTIWTQSCAMCSGMPCLSWEAGPDDPAVVPSNPARSVPLSLCDRPERQQAHG